MVDRRDPQALGELLLSLKKTRSGMGMSELYDEFVPGMMIANYEETEEEFKLRCQEKFARPVGSLQN